MPEHLFGVHSAQGRHLYEKAARCPMTTAVPLVAPAPPGSFQVIKNAMEPLNCISGSDGRSVVFADPSIVCDGKVDPQYKYARAVCVVAAWLCASPCSKPRQLLTTLQLVSGATDTYHRAPHRH
jgi:hypothetical protein